MTKVNTHQRTLYLMRHATASMDADSDFDRPLTLTGERDARHMGRWLNDNHPEADQIVASPAFRAKSTATILMEELHQQHTIQYEKELYEASVRTFLQVINELAPKYSSVLIVAHNPSITYLADYLTSEGLDGMMPGAMIGLGFDVDEWSSISQQSGEIIFTMTPNQL